MSSMEDKLTTLVTRINEVEGRLSFLEDAENQLRANPPATKIELEALRKRVDDMEDRSRHNDLHFFGIPEGCKSVDQVAFSERAIYLKCRT